MESLIDLCASKVVCDLRMLKKFTKSLNRSVLYKLVWKCFKEPKKLLAFSTLVQEWPLTYFSVKDIKIHLQDKEYVLLAELIQHETYGCINLFDLVCEKFDVVDETCTIAFCQAYFSQLSMVQNTSKVARISRSYADALQAARKMTCLSQCSNVVDVSRENMRHSPVEMTDNSVRLSCQTAVVRIGMLVNEETIDKIIQICKHQLESTNDNFLQISLVNLRFEYLLARRIVKVLNYVDSTCLNGLDLSYNCLSLDNRFETICEKIQMFHDLEYLSLAYNNLESEHCSELTGCLNHFPKLNYLNLAWNQLGKLDESLSALVAIGLKTKNLQTLILSGCGVRKDTLQALVNSSRLNTICKLCLDQNFQLLESTEVFLKLLLHLKQTLRYLDISSCGISKMKILNVCPVICELQYLKCFVIWPNPSITAESINNEVLPQLQKLTYLESVPPVTFLCCQCGTPTPPNPSNICIACIRSQVDITEGIQKQAYLQFCKGCERYFQPPNMWTVCQLESKELLAICLKRLKGLNKSHLIDAGFVWTEPHSKRIKVKLTIQQEVLGSTILQQTFVVEFIVQSQMCDDCHRREAKDFWKAVVQIRQKAVHKKTFYYLEQLIIKHNIQSNCLNIKQVHEGLDFYFASKQHARRLVDFLNTVVPARVKTSERLISHDIHNNTYNYKYTFSVELAPVCKNDIVCLPVKVARSLGNIHQIAICYKVTSNLHFLDPFTGKVAELNKEAFWRSPFSTFCSAKQLAEFTVLDVEKNRETIKNKYCQADVYLMRNNDMTGSDVQFHCRTHFGHVLNPGDLAVGLDFSTSNFNDANLEKMDKDNMPDVVLVKKVYGDRKRRRRKRNWKLKELPLESDRKEDYEDFLEDLEEDKDFRAAVNIYRDRTHVAPSESDAEDLPRVGLEEMLDDMHLTDQEMNSDEED